MVVKDTGGNFARPETGMVQAVCSHIYDLGMVPGFQGKMTHKLVILWELDERLKDGEYAGQRFVISKFYTASLQEKANLRADLVSWRGRDFTPDELRGFDLDHIIGANCYLNLVEKKKANGDPTVGIAAIAPFKVKEGGPAKMERELAADYIPEWIKKLMAPAAERTDGKPGDDFEDDIPF